MEFETILWFYGEGNNRTLGGLFTFSFSYNNFLLVDKIVIVFHFIFLEAVTFSDKVSIEFSLCFKQIVLSNKSECGSAY